MSIFNLARFIVSAFASVHVAPSAILLAVPHRLTVRYVYMPPDAVTCSITVCGLMVYQINPVKLLMRADDKALKLFCSPLIHRIFP